MTTDGNTTADQLLEAHVAFVMAELTGDQFETLVQQEVSQVMDDATQLTVRDMVSPEQIRATARRYAVEWEPSGAIPELVGDIARRIYDHPGHDQAVINDLISDDQFAEMLGKGLEMKALRDRIIHEVVSNPVYEALVSDITYQGIMGYMTENPVTRNVPGAQSAMKMGKSVAGKVGPNLEKNLKSYIHKNLKPLLRESENFLQQRLDEERVHEAGQEIWNNIKHHKVSEFRDYVSQGDMEEFFVIGYEYWKTLRKTDYYGSWIDTGVDFFFEKYGATSLTALLEELGISRQMILDEIMRFTPGILAALRDNGMLEATVRRHLSRFYSSESARSILEG